MSALPKLRQPDDDLSVQVAELAQAVRVLTMELARRGDASARLLTPQEVADLWSYGKSAVYDMMSKGILPVVRASDDGTKRVPLIALQAFILRRLEESPNVDSDMIARLLAREE